MILPILASGTCRTDSTTLAIGRGDALQVLAVFGRQRKGWQDLPPAVTERFRALMAQQPETTFLLVDQGAAGLAAVDCGRRPAAQLALFPG